MNASYHLEHLQVLQHINGISNHILASSSDTSGSNLPLNAKTVHYSLDGKSISSHSITSYNDVKVSPSGRIIGGSISHTSTDNSQKELDSSDVHFTSAGKPGLINTQVNNRFKDGIYKSVTSSLMDVVWSEVSSIKSGNISINITNKNNHAPQTSGCLVFENEKISKGHFQHYSSGTNEKIYGYTDIDYKDAKQVGTQIVGGYCAISSKNPDKIEKSTSNIFMTNLGRVDQIHTKNFDTKTKQLKNSVICEFKDMEFNERNEFLNGNSHYTILDNKNNLLSKTTVEYEDRKPKSSTTLNYKENKVNNTTVTEFSGAEFNNDLNVIDSETNTKVINLNSQVITQTVSSYNSNGYPLKRISKNLDPNSSEILAVIELDYKNTMFDHQNNPVDGYSTSTVTNPKTKESTTTIKHYKNYSGIKKIPSIENESVVESSMEEVNSSRVSISKDKDGNVIAKKETIERADGTKIKTIFTQIKDNNPELTKISIYDTDGSSVIKTYSIDLSQIDYDIITHTMKGSMGLKSYFRGDTINTDTTLEY